MQSRVIMWCALTRNSTLMILFAVNNTQAGQGDGTSFRQGAFKSFFLHFIYINICCLTALRLQLLPFMYGDAASRKGLAEQVQHKRSDALPSAPSARQRAAAGQPELE